MSNMATASTTATLDSTEPSPYLNNASNGLPISVDLSSSARDFQLVEVARILCPTLRGSSCEDLTAKPLSGGLSNVLFIVTSFATKNQVLVRIQSSTQDNEEHALVNVEEENRIMAWLSQQGKAPTYYGRFENGRVEEFYDGYSPLSSAEMVFHQKQIASLLASIHKSVPPESVLPRNNNNSAGQCWSTIQKWLDIYKSLQQQQQEESMDECLQLEYLQRELAWLQGQLTTSTTTTATEDTNSNNKNAAIQYCRQVVFCHMDAQSLNLLRKKEDIKLIDYEYASWNARAADIANTWCEYCDMNNLRANYQEQYPSQQHQEDFLQAYLESMGDTTFDQQDYPPIMVLEINKHACLSHLLWTVWSLVQSKQSDIDFDYMRYAKQRMEGYHYFKDQYFK